MSAYDRIVDGTASMRDYVALGYMTRTQILDRAKIYNSTSRSTKKLDKPDLVVNGIGLYDPDHACQIIYKLFGNCSQYSNRMAFMFIAGEFMPPGRRIKKRIPV